MDIVKLSRGSLLYVTDKNSILSTPKYVNRIEEEIFGNDKFYTIYFEDDSIYDVSNIGKFLYLNKEDYKNNAYHCEVITYNGQYLKVKILYDNCLPLFKYLKERYNFDGLLHSTTIPNLISIIKYKNIWPRNLLDYYGVRYDDKANSSVISNTDLDVQDYVRFYYYYKTPTNFHSRPSAIIVLDNEKVSRIQLENVRIYDGNAASQYSKYTTSINEALNYDWDTIFERGAYDSSNKEITRKRNAEFLIYDMVSLDIVKYIIFKNEDDLKYVEKYCDNELKRKLRVDWSKFN